MPSNHERHLPSRPDTRHRLRLGPPLIALLAAVAAIAAMECIVFNLPFWRTLGASTDTNAVHNTLGSGLTRRNDGMLTVTDPTKAYLELTADGTSDYLRIDTESSKVIDKAREQAEAESKANDDKEVFKPLATIHVRADVDGITGKAQSMNPDAIRSHYVKAPGAGIVRIWIQEERGAIVPVTDARANVRVPFVINWMRVLAMALVLLMIAVWRPGSRLWRITLDPSSTRQRLAFVGLLAIPTLLIGVSIIHELWYTSSLVFHVSGDYTYDFDQYGHVADALVAGRPWLDLPVPEQLAATEHPASHVPSYSPMEPVRSTGITRIMTVTGIPILACCPQCCCSSPIVCWPVIICRHPPPSIFSCCCSSSSSPCWCCASSIV